MNDIGALTSRVKDWRGIFRVTPTLLEEYLPLSQLPTAKAVENRMTQRLMMFWNGCCQPQ
jgi:hypothetical protein